MSGLFKISSMKIFQKLERFSFSCKIILATLNHPVTLKILILTQVLQILATSAKLGACLKLLKKPLANTYLTKESQ